MRDSTTKSTDLATLQKARPYLRSAMAFMLYLRFGAGHKEGSMGIKIQRAYDLANEFLNELTADVEKT